MPLVGSLLITGVEVAVSIGSSAVTIGTSVLGILGTMATALADVHSQIMGFISA